ncbi:hypothetical protein [Alsobacter soli]|uniref:hypothetical protein n=1 Tax=Alsobacter soli TaxID=2109933 RepID=UPI0011B23DFC|nr:hypothetical protein [Alsobacter soli]
MKVSQGLAAVFLMAGLSGCVTAEQANQAYASARPATAQQKAGIISKVRNVFFDPYSIRDAELSYVMYGNNGRGVVCLHANSKNRMGGYVGRSYTAFLLDQSGAVISSDDGPGITRDCADARLRYMPFPEAEKL